MKDPNNPSRRGDMYVHFDIRVPKPSEMSQEDINAMELLMAGAKSRGGKT